MTAQVETFRVTKHPSFSPEVSSFRSGEVKQRSGAASLVVCSGQMLYTTSFLVLTDAASLVTSEPQLKVAEQHVTLMSK